MAESARRSLSVRVSLSLSLEVATPGRLVHHLKVTSSFKVSKLTHVVHDEVYIMAILHYNFFPIYLPTQNSLTI